MTIRKIALAFAISLSTAVAAADLPRRASLGVALAPAPQGAGATVDAVLPGQSGETLGLRKGDTIVEAGGRPVEAPSAVIVYAGTLAAGDRIDLKIRRGGKVMPMRGKALPRPLEAYRGARVDYGAVPFRGGQLRDFLVMPDAVPEAPVVYMIQGFSCGSVESSDPGHPYRRLGEELIARGIGYYRVEKPGIGDSAGTPACADIDFATEMDAFRAAYNHLIQVRGVDPDRIFMFGHSLGGIQAPLLAAERAPRGVAAYGTVLRNWADYHHDLDVFQSYLFTGADPAAGAATAERNREILRLFYFERQSPAEIAAAKPELAEGMRNIINWDGRDRTMGRHYKFMQDIAHQPVIAAWRNTKSNVLSIYGESDVVALFDTDHKVIADMANWHRPGSGRYVEVPATDHGMTKVGNRFELRQKTIATGGKPPDGEFNVAVAEAVASWVKDSMTRPPVRTLAERPAPAPIPSGG